MRHLFVALAKGPWGELVLGLRVAADLAARGDEIVFLAPREHQMLFAELPYQVDYIDDVFNFDARRRVPQAVSHFVCDTLVLVDLTVFFFHLKQIRCDADFLQRIDVPVLALDIWNVPASNRTLDFADVGYITSRHALAVTRRLVPVPFIAPDADPGCFNSLPPLPPVTSAERAEARATLGIGDAPLVLTTTANWQLPKAVPGNAAIMRNATQYPKLVAGYLEDLGDSLHVVHVSPEPSEHYAAALGARYHHRPSLPQPEFRRVLAAADVFLTFNLPATTIASAIAAGIPVLVGVNSYAGSAEEVRARLPPGSSRTSAWLDAAAPLHRFRAWPYGYYDFMAALLENNPYLDAVRMVEVLEEAAFLDACNDLLSASPSRLDACSKQADYRARVASLPSAAERVAALLGRS